MRLTRRRFAWSGLALVSLFALASTSVSGCSGGGGGGMPCGLGASCADGEVCRGGSCVPDETASDVLIGLDGVPCVPSCGDRVCGDDGCGGSCGPCGEGTWCTPEGVCEEGTCVPACDGKACGPDGCGAVCGACPTGMACTADGQCTGACAPDCDDKACGPDGCGGLCGTCGDGQTCAAGACVAGVCGESAPTIEGAIETDVTSLVFERVTVSLSHKQDIDPWEDGCVVSVALQFERGYGCEMRLTAGGAWSSTGGLRLTDVDLQADSQCPGFPDEREGHYRDAGGLTVAELVLGARNVPDANAPESCFMTTVAVHLAGTLREVDSGAELTVIGSTLRVTGELRSQGDTRASCPCAAACDGRDCGDDGCGFSCGDCGAFGVCDEGVCVCTPECGDHQCGDDGCGGSCGDCPAGLDCLEGSCVCLPDCDGRECGDDGCGGSCGACALGLDCLDGRCACVPDCAHRDCGDDGCGGSCGTCAGSETCSANGRCGCEASCEGRECGDDGCGGSCGACGQGETCEDGRCGCGDIDFLGCCDGNVTMWCSEQGSVEIRDCGPQGCGWVDLQTGNYCGGSGEDPSGEHPHDCRLGPCEPQCAGRGCGPDGCGGSCGSCPDGEACSDGLCAPCTPQCAGRGCGPDGCGGSCGACPDGEVCSDGLCFGDIPAEEYGKPCTSSEDCLPPLDCLTILGEATMCTVECVAFVDTCPNNGLCLPDFSGSGVSHCIWAGAR